MRVTHVTVKRTKQVKQYEPEVIELTVEVGPKESVAEAIYRARTTIAQHFNEPIHPVVGQLVKPTCGEVFA